MELNKAQQETLDTTELSRGYRLVGQYEPCNTQNNASFTFSYFYDDLEACSIANQRRNLWCLHE